MKKLLGIVVLGLLISGNVFASIIVCTNNRDGQDTIVIAIDKKQKFINLNNETIYNVTEGEGYGTGRGGSPMLGDLWGMDETGTRAIAINRFTFKARKKDMAAGRERFYECRKADSNTMLF